MAGTETGRQKELGAFYTPQAMAEKLVAWAVRSRNDSVLDPSFGGLVFLETAAVRLAELGCATDQIAAQIHGIELDEEAFAAASRSDPLGSANLTQGDFFSIMPGSQAPLCRAVVGNPPYVRYQGFNGHGHAGHKLAAAAGVPLTRLASSWAPFVIHAVSFLEAGGRLALVLPAEVIHAQYAEPVLEFLRRNFARVELAVFEERIFPGALEEVVLLFADERGEGPAPQIEIVPSQSLDGLRVGQRKRTVPVSRAAGREQLLAQLLPPAAQELYWQLTEDEEVTTLGQWGSVDIGAVTGANSFFLLDAEMAEKLPAKLLRPAVSKAHQIPGAAFAHRDYLALRQSGGKVQMLVAEAKTDPRLLSEIERYIRRGKRLGLHRRYKCRVRDPWWAVPLPTHGTPDLFLTYFASDHPRLVVNSAEALHTNTIHGVKLGDRRRARSLASGFYNSLTLLSAELVGRSYGGGVLKFEPSEAEALLIPPLPAGLGRQLPRVDRLIRAKQLAPALDLIDRRMLIEGLGLSGDQVKALREGAERLRQRRRSRGQNPR